MSLSAIIPVNCNRPRGHVRSDTFERARWKCLTTPRQEALYMAGHRRRRVLPISSSSSSSSNLDSPLSLSPPSRQMPDDNRFSDCFPLSLQDMCLLNVLQRVEDFPIQSLAYLPRGIRKRIYLGLSHADILHIDGDNLAVLFDGLNLEFDHSRQEHEQRGPIIAREELLDVILCGDLSKFFSLNLDTEVLDLLKDDERIPQIVLYEHIQKCYTPLGAILVPSSMFCSSFLLPRRLLQFVGTLQFESYSEFDCHLQLPSHLAWPLLHYCNVHYAPKELKIDCFDFQKTAFWNNYEEALNEKKKENNCPMSKMDPIIPFMQEFLSNVEVLEIGTNNSPRDVHGLDEALHTVPYVLLYNALTSSQPHLKHLKVYGIPVHTSWILETIAELVCTIDLESAFHSYTRIPLASSKPNPCRIEGLSISPFEINHGYACDYMIGSIAHTIASISKSIIVFQMQTLSSVTVQGLGFCYSDDAFDVRDFYEDRIDGFRSKRDVNSPAFITLLNLLSQLLKQPHFQTLNVGQSPHLVACTLIETFLTTPTSHEQLLSIEGKDKPKKRSLSESSDDAFKSESESKEDKLKSNKSRKRRDELKSSDIPPKKLGKLMKLSLPETNTQYKCLDLGFSSSCVYSWLFTLPELRLKELRMRTQDMTIVPADMVIQVEHIVFTTETCSFTSYKPTIFPAHLEKFIVSNSALKRLEFTEPTDECVPGLIPALNHCLSILYQQGRGLEELVLKFARFYNQELMREFFIRVRDISHHYGTTLVLSDVFYPREEDSCFFADLSKAEFQVNKIRKIIITAEYEMYDTCMMGDLGLLAMEMVLRLSVCLRTYHDRIVKSLISTGSIQ